MKRHGVERESSVDMGDKRAEGSMLPRIVVVGRKDDALGRALTARAAEPPFSLEFHPGGDSLVDSLRDECPSLLVIGLRGRRGTAVGALVRRIKAWCPQLPVVIACLDESAPGREILHAARAGAEHFAFRDADDFPSVLGAIVAPTARAPKGAVVGAVGGEVSRARALSDWRRPARRTRYAERAPSTILGVLPASVSPLLRRIIHACVASVAPETVDELASRIALPKRSLTREVSRRGWPSPHVLLNWGRLFRGAAAGAYARLEGKSWDEAQWVIAVEAGYGSVRTASRAYRTRAGIGLREIWRDGASALLPAFLTAVRDSPQHRLAS
jgi:hypothetical protein